MPRVAILTGPTHSGKTGALSATVRGPGAAGLLAPDVVHGRIFEDLATGELERFQVHDETEATVAIGPYRFRAAAFEWGNARLKTAAAGDARVIVVDEVGPLELRGEGLAPGVRAVLARPAGTAVLIVRESLVHAAQAYFGVTAEVATVAGWPQLWQDLNAAP